MNTNVSIDLLYGNGDFSESEEEVYTGVFNVGENGTPATPIVGLINVPDNALLGATRMRISMQRANPSESCGRNHRLVDSKVVSQCTGVWHDSDGEC